MDFERKQVDFDLANTVILWGDDDEGEEEDMKIPQMNEVRFGQICSHIRAILSRREWFSVEELAESTGQSMALTGHALETLTKDTQNVLSCRDPVTGNVVYRMGRPHN